MSDYSDKVVYALVSRGNDTVLTDNTVVDDKGGNFKTYSLQALKKINMNRKMGAFITANFKFYIYNKDGYAFLLMCGSDYSQRIAIMFLNDVADKFFNRYSPEKLNKAIAHSLSDFNSILRDRLKTFNTPEDVDKFTLLQKKVGQIQNQAYQILDKVIERDIQINILLEKTQTMSKMSYDLNVQAGKVKWHMYFKNKKIQIAIVLIILLVIFVAVWMGCGITFSRCK